MKKPFEQRKGVWGGIPVFSGTRVPVFIFLDFVEGDLSVEEFLYNYEVVTREQIESLLRFPLAPPPK